MSVTSNHTNLSVGFGYCLPIYHPKPPRLFWSFEELKVLFCRWGSLLLLIIYTLCRQNKASLWKKKNLPRMCEEYRLMEFYFHTVVWLRLILCTFSVRLVERKKAAVKRCEEQLLKLEVQATDREENKQIALGTSKLNYLDPRISVAWWVNTTNWGQMSALVKALVHSSLYNQMKLNTRLHLGYLWRWVHSLLITITTAV